MAVDLEEYRREADRFIAALDEEYYLHFAGLKDQFELGPIYERYADLTTLEAATSLGETAAEPRNGVVELWRFACEGYLGDITREQAEEIARLEATVTASVDGEELPYRMIRPTIANEPDRGRRKRLEELRTELAEEHLTPHHRIAEEKVNAAVGALGAPSYGELYARFGLPLDTLGEQCQAFLADTEELYVRTIDRLFQSRLGVGLDDAERWDIPRLFRASDWDAGFPADAMVPALEGTLAGLGIELREQENVHLDLEPRPKKSPRAFCAPIEVPSRVMLVIKPIGGPDDWHAFFHEAGHAEHYGNVAPGLPVEQSRLGDASITECWAALFEHLVDDPVWLSRRLSFGKPREFAAEAAAGHLYLARRYAGKLLYELELHGRIDLAEARARYLDWMREATKIEFASSDFLSDVDAGFYSSCYLRSWALEARFREFLREEFGTAWFASRDAGSLLRELWSEGQRASGGELLHEVTGAELELDAVHERVREAL
jgi:hypothetical protein